MIANHERPEQLTCDAATVARLTEMLCKRWHVPKLSLHCLAGEFTAPGYFIEATTRGLHRTGIVDPSGAELVHFVDEPEPDFGTSINGYIAADLDGDGEDEIIESWGKSSPFALRPDSWLIVRTVAHHRFRTIQGPYLSRYHPELGGCSSKWELYAGTIRVAVAVLPGIPPTDCLQAGTHTFRLHGRTLIDARR